MGDCTDCEYVIDSEELETLQIAHETLQEELEFYKNKVHYLKEQLGISKNQKRHYTDVTNRLKEVIEKTKAEVKEQGIYIADLQKTLEDKEYLIQGYRKIVGGATLDPKSAEFLTTTSDIPLSLSGLIVEGKSEISNGCREYTFRFHEKSTICRGNEKYKINIELC